MTYEILGNSIIAWLFALGIVVAITLAVAAAKWFVLNRLSAIAQRTSTTVDDAVVEAGRRTYQVLIFVAATFIASRVLQLPAQVVSLLGGAATVALFIQVGLWGGAVFAYGLSRYRDRAIKADVGAATSFVAFSFIGNLLIWTLILLLTLDNLGVDVTALVAGLGIGGVAVALAVQSILGDLFASFSIITDKPFVVGDFIVVGEHMGTVEQVGLKTTHLRSLGGEQLIIPNGDLLSARVRNYKRMQERRIVFKFGVLYQTTLEQLEAIPGIVRRIVEQQEKARFERAHFSAFGESAYDFEVVYWMLVPEYNIYMDTQQAINLALVREFAEQGIEFAFPTRTLIMGNAIKLETEQPAVGRTQQRQSESAHAKKLNS